MKYFLDPMNIRKLKNNFFLSISVVFALVAIFFLFFILMTVIKNGLQAFDLKLFTQDQMPPLFQDQGGLRFAIVGHIIITGLAILIAIPIGILAGVYLAEYGKYSKLRLIVTSLSDIMVSVPSIVIGTFIYGVLVVPFGGYSAIAGAASLAIIMIPVVLRITEDMLSLVPKELREAAFALGAPLYKVVKDVVLRAAASGIMTGAILAIARVAGETAPLLFTSFSKDNLSIDITEPMASLTVTTFNYASSGYPRWVDLGWSAALLITIFILFINILGKTIISLKAKNK